MADFKLKDYTEYTRDDLLSEESPLVDYEFTDSLDYDGKFEVDAQPVLTGGILRTSGSDTNRTQISAIEPRTYNLGNAGSEHQGLYIIQDGVARIVLDENALSFFRPSDGLGSASIYGVGTNQLYIDTGDEQFIFDTSLYPATDGLADLGTAVNQWNTIYLVNAPVVSSDIRGKHEIKDLEYGIETIRKLHAVSYKRQDDSVHLGFIAQDVAKVVPEVVRGNEKDGYALAYEEFIPILVKAVRELSDKVEQLEHQKMV